jgi:hypothetical protein
MKSSGEEKFEPDQWRAVAHDCRWRGYVLSAYMIGKERYTTFWRASRSLTLKCGN